MLPFKTSSVYKVEPRRDFVVQPRAVSKAQPKRTSEFYDIGKVFIVFTIECYTTYTTLPLFFFLVNIEY